MLSVQVVNSLHELTSMRRVWNELWECSESFSALTRCEPLEIFIKHFAEDKELQIILVFDQKRLVGALPLLVGKRNGVKVAELPNNEWSCSGDLLVHRDYNNTLTIKALVEGINQIGTLAVWLDWIAIDQPRWQLFLKTVKQKGQSCFSKKRFDVAILEVPESYDQFQKGLSKNHRKKMKQAMRRLAECGKIDRVNYEPEKWETHLREALVIEDSSWKGAEGTSICSATITKAYVRELVESLHRQGFLGLEFLRIDGKAIAFDLGWVAKGVRASWKISFSSEFARFSPGQLLVGMQVEQASKASEFQSFDTIGPKSEAIAKWTDRSYSMGRIFLSNDRWTSKMAVRTMGQFANVLRQLKNLGVPQAATN